MVECEKNGTIDLMEYTEHDYDVLGRYISYLLRHHPESAGLEMDDGGWVDADELVEAVVREYGEYDRFSYDDLCELVANNDKQRYALSEDGSRIRANQGHSFHVDLGLSPIEPPDVLFHGTATRFVDSIMADGLLSQTRTQVHLSGDVDTAVSVGKRHGKPCVLTVDAARMYDDGYDFFLSDNGVWLTDHVPAEYLSAE